MQSANLDKKVPTIPIVLDTGDMTVNGIGKQSMKAELLMCNFLIVTFWTSNFFFFNQGGSYSRNLLLHYSFSGLGRNIHRYQQLGLIRVIFLGKWCSPSEFTESTVALPNVMSPESKWKLEVWNLMHWLCNDYLFPKPIICLCLWTLELRGEVRGTSSSYLIAFCNRGS